MMLNPLRLAPAALFVLVSACAGSADFPSLNPRPIEAKAADLLNEPTPPPVVPAPSDPAMAQQINAARQLAQASAAPFEVAAARADQAVAGAGPAESESWIAAQMAVSAAEQARAGVKTALADLDSLLRRLIAAGPSEDLSQVEQAIRDVEALDAQQSERMVALLGGLNR